MERYQTWLQIWFDLPVIITGFGFDSDEIFLRWLLIERRLLRNLQNKPIEVLYLCKKMAGSSIKNFMENLGVEFVPLIKRPVIHFVKVLNFVLVF